MAANVIAFKLQAPRNTFRISRIFSKFTSQKKKLFSRTHEIDQQVVHGILFLSLNVLNWGCTIAHTCVLSKSLADQTMQATETKKEMLHTIRTVCIFLFTQVVNLLEHTFWLHKAHLRMVYAMCCILSIVNKYFIIIIICTHRDWKIFWKNRFSEKARGMHSVV